MDRAVYLDSSALVKLVIEEPETVELRRYLETRTPRVSSALARVEVVRWVRAHGAQAVSRARELLKRIHLLRIDKYLLDSAAALDVPLLRSLDAIHLASAQTLGDDLEALVTYDRRMGDAAAVLGLGRSPTPERLRSQPRAELLLAGARFASAAVALALLAVPTAAVARWRPPARPTWYSAAPGARRQSVPAAVYDIDGFENGRGRGREAARARQAGRVLHRRRHVGELRPTPAVPPLGARAAERLAGRAVAGHPQAVGARADHDRALADVRAQAVRRSRARQHRRVREPHRLSDHAPASSCRFDEWIAREAHSLGLAVFQKNDPEQARRLEPDFDGVLDEQCNQYQECASFRPYLRRRQAGPERRYSLVVPRLLRRRRRAGIMGALYGLALDGRSYAPCW